VSDASRRLPDGPNLDHLRKQAKDRLALLRVTSPGAALHDAQLALAREYGFASWPKLVQHVAAVSGSQRVAMYESLARDLVDGHAGDEEALRRLNGRFGTSYSMEQLHVRVRDALDGLRAPGDRGQAGSLSIDDARLFVARLHRLESWSALVGSGETFFRLDDATGTLEPGLLVADADWDIIMDTVRELGIRRLQLGSRATDAVLARLPSLPSVTSIDLGGATRISDEGLQALAGMPQLEELDLSGWYSPITDTGLGVLRHLPRLRRFSMCWPQRVTDAGVAQLTHCEQLERVNLIGTNTGDGAINALAGRRRLAYFVTGKGVTDAGMRRLRDFPVFRSWQGGAPRYGLMTPDAEPNHLSVSGSFTGEGLRALEGLDGLFAFSIFGDAPGLVPDDLRHLATLPRLGMLGCDGTLADDVGMAHIGSLPELRMAMVQGTVATDAGFEALSRSRTLEHLWGRECPNLTGRGFVAMAGMPALRGLAVSCRHVDDRALSSLPSFPALRHLMPMDVSDAGFRHVGRCQELEKLWCMYCRDTGDDATRHIQALALRHYYAGKTRITDVSLEILSGMTTLESIELWETAGVTNAGVRALATLPHLRSLTIDGAPHVTRDVLASFGTDVHVRI